MATRTRTAVSFFVTALLVVFLCAPVWAQSQEEALRQMAASMATMSQAMQRLAQAPAQPALTHTAPVSQVGPADYLTREEWNVFLAGDFASLKRRVGKVESLVGRIAPRSNAAPAPAKPTTSGPVAQATANSSPGHVKVVPPAAEQYRAVAFSGDIPNKEDIAGIKKLLGPYEVAQAVIMLPAPGKDHDDQAIHAAARNATLNAAWGGNGVATREPVNDFERDQLVAGAPAGTGAVFHLRLKKAAVAATPTTP